MLLKILGKIILRNFTTKVANFVLNFCFVTRLFNQTNLNKKQIPSELSFLTGMSAVNSSCSKKECRILASYNNKFSPSLYNPIFIFIIFYFHKDNSKSIAQFRNKLLISV